MSSSQSTLTISFGDIKLEQVEIETSRRNRGRRERERERETNRITRNTKRISQRLQILSFPDIYK